MLVGVLHLWGNRWQFSSEKGIVHKPHINHASLQHDVLRWRWRNRRDDANLTTAARPSRVEIHGRIACGGQNRSRTNTWHLTLVSHAAEWTKRNGMKRSRRLQVPNIVHGALHTPHRPDVNAHAQQHIDAGRLRSARANRITERW